jgi:stage V sporulation protein G
MNVEITDVRIFKIIGTSNIKAYANVTLSDEFAVHGVKVMAREDGTLWVSMPRQKSASDGQWWDVFHPITSESRERLHEAVLQAYEKFVGKGREKSEELEKSQLEAVKEKAESPSGGVEEEKARK